MSDASSPRAPGQPGRQFGYRRNMKNSTQFLYGPVFSKRDAMPASMVDPSDKTLVPEAEKPAGEPVAAETE